MGAMKKIGMVGAGVMVMLILVGIAFLVGGPIMMEGFDATIHSTNATSFTLVQTFGKLGPGLIIGGCVGVIIVALFVAAMSAKKKES